MKILGSLFLLTSFLLSYQSALACSILYYIDSKTGKIYFVNNEDYWYGVKPYIHIIPHSEKELGRLWYGWGNFGQGGVNEKGLVMDGASTPDQSIPKDYNDPDHVNITDKILAHCSNVDEAIAFVEKYKIALKKAHIFFGDRNGKAVVIEWVNGIRQIINIQNNRLIATNFNLSDSTQQTTQCWRYRVITEGLEALDTLSSSTEIDLKIIGNVMAKAVQLPQEDSTGRIGGTLYTSFINLSEMKFILVYKLDNSKIYTLDLQKEFYKGKRRKIKLV